MVISSSWNFFTTHHFLCAFSRTFNFKKPAESLDPSPSSPSIYSTSFLATLPTPTTPPPLLVPFTSPPSRRSAILAEKCAAARKLQIAVQVTYLCMSMVAFGIGIILISFFICSVNGNHVGMAYSVF